ncbi:hypothetical protein FRC17_004907, partial [Serendipita sp. 399]
MTPVLPPLSPPLSHPDYANVIPHRPRTPSPRSSAIPGADPMHGPGPVRTPKKMSRRQVANPISFSAFIEPCDSMVLSPSKAIVYEGIRVYRLSHSRTGSSDMNQGSVSDEETEDDDSTVAFLGTRSRERDAAEVLLSWR